MTLSLNPEESALPTPTPSVDVCQVAATTDFIDYISEGPLVISCGLTPEAVRANAGEWQRLGRQLAVQLSFDHDNMDPVQK